MAIKKYHILINRITWLGRYALWFEWKINGQAKPFDAHWTRFNTFKNIKQILQNQYLNYTHPLETRTIGMQVQCRPACLIAILNYLLSILFQFDLILIVQEFVILVFACNEFTLLSIIYNCKLILYIIPSIIEGEVCRLE